MSEYIELLEKELDEKSLSVLKEEIIKSKEYNLKELLEVTGYENDEVKDFVKESTTYFEENGEAKGNEDLFKKYIDETKGEIIKGCFTRNKEVIFLLGLPGSGKSSSLKKISQKYGNRKYYFIDADDYKSGKEDENGNEIISPLADKSLKGVDIEALHELSSKIAKMIIEILSNNSFDIALPKVGDDYKSLIKSIKTLKDKGYKIYVHFLFTTIVTALKRNLQRFINAKNKNEKIRLVPAQLIFEMGYKPLFNFFQVIKTDICDDFALWDGENCEYGNPNLLFQK